MNRINLFFIQQILLLSLLLSGFSQFKEVSAKERLTNRREVSILTVGNSFSNNACAYLEAIASSVKGCSISIAKASLGGCSLERHVSLLGACEKDPAAKPYAEKYCLKDLLQMDKYDFITIQQVSTSSFKPETFQPYADRLIGFIREYAPGSQIMVHQTWAYAGDSQRLKDWGISREEMHIGLVKSYRQLSDSYNLDILPSGAAFWSATNKDTNIDLWVKDRYHANPNGCYLAGCVWFGKFFGVSPRKVTFVPEGMERKTAVFLRKVAARELKKTQKSKE